jgi:hypothetical protein
MKEETKSKIKAYFDNPEQFIVDIYCNGGLDVNGWGYISGGYGGGITQEQGVRLLWQRGFLAGLRIADKKMANELMKALNDGLLEMFPSMKKEDLPFINLE